MLNASRSEHISIRGLLVAERFWYWQLSVINVGHTLSTKTAMVVVCDIETMAVSTSVIVDVPPPVLYPLIRDRGKW